MHVADHMCSLTIEHNIHLFCLPLHMMHRLQPLDVGMFGPLQSAWQNTCSGKDCGTQRYCKHLYANPKCHFHPENYPRCLAQDRNPSAQLKDFHWHWLCTEPHDFHTLTCSFVLSHHYSAWVLWYPLIRWSWLHEPSKFSLKQLRQCLWVFWVYQVFRLLLTGNRQPSHKQECCRRWEH